VVAVAVKSRHLVDAREGAGDALEEARSHPVPHPLVLGLHEPVADVLQLLHPGDQELPPGGRLAGPEIRRAVGEVDVVVAGDEPLEHDALLGGSGHSWWRHPTPAGAATTSRR